MSLLCSPCREPCFPRVEDWPTAVFSSSMYSEAWLVFINANVHQEDFDLYLEEIPSSDAANVLYNVVTMLHDKDMFLNT